MPYKCSVPGCYSNNKHCLKAEGYIQLFKFPKDCCRREEWVRAIHRPDWSPTNSSFVCVKHFHSDDLSMIENFFKDGQLCEYRRNRPVLREHAIPRIFPNPLDNLSDYRSCPRVKRKMPEESRKKEETRIASFKVGSFLTSKVFFLGLTTFPILFIS